MDSSIDKAKLFFSSCLAKQLRMVDKKTKNTVVPFVFLFFPQLLTGMSFFFTGPVLT